MAEARQYVAEQQTGVVAAHKVLRNTYMLLSLTLIFSAAMAGVSMALNVPHPGFLVTIVGFIGLLFLVNKLRNSVWGIAAVFAFTGFIGFFAGPIVSYYIAATGGTQVVFMSLGMTGAIFFALSGYVLTTKTDFSYLSGFITAGLVIVLMAFLVLFIGPMFDFYVPGLHLAVSAAIVLLMSALILYETSAILHGGETNYLMATVSLYLSIYNLFMSLMSLLSIMDD